MAASFWAGQRRSQRRVGMRQQQSQSRAGQGTHLRVVTALVLVVRGGRGPGGELLVQVAAPAGSLAAPAAACVGRGGGGEDDAVAQLDALATDVVERQLPTGGWGGAGGSSRGRGAPPLTGR